MNEFNNKKIVLTGASSGIGYALLKYFINEGAIVFGSSRNKRELTKEDEQKCNFELFSKYFHGLLNKGIYIAPSQHEAGFISLSHDEHILDFTISVIDEVLNELMVPVS